MAAEFPTAKVVELKLKQDKKKWGNSWMESIKHGEIPEEFMGLVDESYLNEGIQLRANLNV